MIRSGYDNATIECLGEKRVTPQEDKVNWIGAVGGDFLVKDAYKILQPRADPLFPIKEIWMPRVPSKSAFYA